MIESRITHKGIFIAAALVFAQAASAGDTLRFIQGDVKLSTVDTLSLKSARSQGTFVVQFSDRIRAEDRAVLEAEGLVVSDYLPDDALVVRGDTGALERLIATTASIRAVTPLRSEWKLAPELAHKTLATREILVRLTDEAALVQIEGRAIAGVEVLSGSDRTLVARVSTQGLLALAAQDEVLWIQDLPRLETFDLVLGEPMEMKGDLPSRTGFESGTKIMNMDAAWGRGYTGKGQIGSIGDTGVSSGNISSIHTDLKGVIKGYTVGLGSTTWDDPQGHGTHVAGSIIASGALSGGLIKGSAYEAQLIPVGLWSPIMNNLMFDQDFTKLFGWPHKDGAMVHSNSWGAAANLGAYDAMAVKADDFLFKNPDMLVLFAAGNSGQDLNKDGRIDEKSVGTPGTAKNVLTVGASENTLAVGGIQKKHSELNGGATKWGAEPIASDTLSNNADGLAAFSSRGPTNDGRLKPELVAPGTNIVSTVSKHPKAGKLWGAFGDEYCYAGGTSMATPLTAGAALVLRQYLVEGLKIAKPTGALVKAALIHTAKDMYPGQYGTGPKAELPKARPNMHEGFGRVDMDAGTSLEGALVVDERAGVALRGELKYGVAVGTEGRLRATLTYMDAPGAANAAKALVNDLDLVVLDANGVVVAESKDRINNTEMLELKDLPAGDYQVVVRGVNVPQGVSGKQPFALLASAE